MGVLACAAGIVFASIPAAQAAQGDWLGRVRIVNISPDASSSARNIDVNSKITPELDFSYFVTRNLALELILVTREHEVTAGGAPVGNVTHLPPTLTLQYHFLPDQQCRPYVGAGINYTRFYDINLGGGTLTLDRASWGPAIQVGMDIAIDKRFFANLDIKKI